MRLLTQPVAMNRSVETPVPLKSSVGLGHGTSTMSKKGARAVGTVSGREQSPAGHSQAGRASDHVPLSCTPPPLPTPRWPSRTLAWATTAPTSPPSSCATCWRTRGGTRSTRPTRPRSRRAGERGQGCGSKASAPLQPPLLCLLAVCWATDESGQVQAWGVDEGCRSRLGSRCVLRASIVPSHAAWSRCSTSRP